MTDQGYLRSSVATARSGYASFSRRLGRSPQAFVAQPSRPLDRVILSGLSIEHVGVKFLERLKQKRDISIARSDKRTIFGIKGSSTTQEDRDDDVTVDGAVYCSIVRVD
jgi:hypothetical protein